MKTESRELIEEGLSFAGKEGHDECECVINCVEASGFRIIPLDILHRFFNHRSDANKYLTATEQEDFEKDFEFFLKEHCKS